MTGPVQPVRRVFTDTAERRFLRTESVTQVRRGDTLATRWEVTTTTPADQPAQVYPHSARPVAGLRQDTAPPVSRRWRWQVLLLAAVGALAVIAGLVWLVVWLVNAVVVVVAALWPTLVGLAVVLALVGLLFSGSGGCGGLHCRGCGKH